jgi:hypothetical protein
MKLLSLSTPSKCCTECGVRATLLMRLSVSPVVQICQGCIEDALGQMEIAGSNRVEAAFLSRPKLVPCSPPGTGSEDSTILKTCSCGKTYSRAAWLALPLVGDYKDDVDHLETRNCVCKSTISLSVIYETSDARWYAQEETT